MNWWYYFRKCLTPLACFRIAAFCTFILGPARYGRRPEDVPAHPVTGAPVEDPRLPVWNAARALLLRASARGTVLWRTQLPAPNNEITLVVYSLR